MANGIIQVAPDSTGKIVDTSELTVGANTVERQRIVLASDTVAAGIANVTNGTAASGDYALVTKQAPLATINSDTYMNVSLGSTTGKTNAISTGALTSTATTANQVIVTRTVTAGKTFYLQGVVFSCRLTTFATTSTFFGAASIETPSGTKVITFDAAGAGQTGIITIPFLEPVPIAAGVVVRVVCTPNATTSYSWKASLIGYEK